MHERVEADVPALLLALVIVVLVSLGLVHQVRLRAARQVEIRKLQQILAAEAERAEEAAVEEYTSMLATRSLCAVCETPTNSRCSRCKSVHYCSSTCQIKHWRQGHKNECGGGSQNLPTIPLAVQPTRKSTSSLELPNTAHTKPIHDEPTKATVHTKPIQAEPRRAQLQASETRVEPTSDGCLAKPKKILFPYDRFVNYFNWDIQRPPCGLINCGNSCFANVILQCLTYTRPLAAFLLEGNHRRECQRNDWCFMCELQDHIWRVFSSQIPFSPIRILSRLRNIGNHLGYGRQEDAHEFMRFAVDSMQSICLDEFGGEKSVDSRSQETTLVQYIFGGHLQSQVKCMQCGHESNRYENMMDLAVEIQGAVESLEDGLAQFTAPEWLDGENKYKCDRCNAYVKASKRLTIHEAPNVLTIALKRFQSGKFGKLNKRVTFPETLNMSPYMSGEGDKPPLYKLYAVVVHVDMLNASFFGHYICYVRDMEGTWYKVDDSKVKEVDLEKVMSQKAYMLMYSRSSARPTPEPDAGSLASSLMDTSVASGRECSSSLCKYQRSSSIGQLHGEVHRMSPIIAGTLVDNRVVEESVDRSYSSLQSSAIERVISLDSSMVDEPSVSDSATGSSLESDTVSSPVAENLSHEVLEFSEVSQPHFCRKTGKRRLETEREPTASKPFAFPGLTRSRSSSCPPVARSHSGSMDTYQFVDDLPRTFGYSLCRRDTESGCSLAANEVQTPSKRQHVLQTNGPEVMDNVSSMDVDDRALVDVDLRVKKLLNSDMISQGLAMDAEVLEAHEDAAVCVSNGSLEGTSLSLDGQDHVSPQVNQGTTMAEMESGTHSVQPEIKVQRTPGPGLESELSNGKEVTAVAGRKKQVEHEENGNLKPIFAKGFLNRSRKEATNSNAHSETCMAGPSKSPSLKDPIERREALNGCLEKDLAWAGRNNCTAATQKQGRNDSCSCGSQRKWKKCCGRVGILKEIEARRLVA